MWELHALISGQLILIVIWPADVARESRVTGDLAQELQDQVLLLEEACRSFDNGLTPIGKHIALSLRVLLHNKNRSKSLLKQLDLLEGEYYDSAGPMFPGNLISDCPLCVVSQSAGEVTLQPLCYSGGGPFGGTWKPFSDWWSCVVINDSNKHPFTRSDLVLNVADTDGGAHVDPTLDEKYMSLSRKNSLNWEIVQGNIVKPFPSPAMPCLRQIAHETLLSFKRNLSSEIEITYAT